MGEVLGELDALGIAGETLVVYTSDHGEMMGAHDMWGKRTFYEGSARVPFVVRWPGRVPAGGRVAEPSELVDLYPTLCAAAGVAPPDDLDGDSLLPLLSGDASGWRGVAVSDYCQWLPAPARMVRLGRWKLNYYTGAGFELFDLGADPDELHDLSARPESRTTLLELLPHLARGGWSPALAEALWRDYQRRGPRLPGGGCARRTSTGGQGLRTWTRRTSTPPTSTGSACRSAPDQIPSQIGSARHRHPNGLSWCCGLAAGSTGSSATRLIPLRAVCCSGAPAGLPAVRASPHL